MPNLKYNGGVHRLQITISNNNYERLKKLCIAQGITMSSFINQAVAGKIEEFNAVTRARELIISGLPESFKAQAVKILDKGGFRDEK